MIEKVLKLDLFIITVMVMSQIHLLAKDDLCEYLETLKCVQMHMRNISISNYLAENNHFCTETNKREPAAHILLHVILRHQ